MGCAGNRASTRLRAAMTFSRFVFPRLAVAVRVLFAAAVVAFGVTLSASAGAQVNSDIGVSVGAMKRFTTGADPGASDPGFGGVAMATGHLAIFPMLRAGLYFSADFSPMPNAGTREFYEGGLHLKFTPPLLSAPWKVFATAGFGFAYVHADAYTSQIGPNQAALPVTTPVQWTSLDGELLDVPLGVGIAYKLAPHTEMFLELGGRFGVAFFGAVYDSNNTDSGTTVNNVPLPQAPFTGIDSFALSLSLGVNWTN